MAVKTLIDVLAADPAVLALVGGPIDYRVTPIVRTQDMALPDVTLIRTAVEPVGLLNGPAPIAKNTVQVQCWDGTYEGARTLADACRSAIEGAGFFWTSEVDNFDASAELSGIYCVTLEFSVWI